jgi:hypothetical protein
MPNCVDVEVRTHTLTAQERAIERDSLVREFERQFSQWTAIAKVCIEVERDRDWEILGFHSWSAWILDAAPKSRSYIYLVTSRYKELIADIPEEELAQIPLGSAGVLKQLSPAVRKSSKIRQAAKEKPEKLRQIVEQEFPEQHLLGLDIRCLKLDTSQAGVFDEALAIYRALNNHCATVEEFVESLCAGYANGAWEDSPYSNRERAKQLA